MVKSKIYNNTVIFGLLGVFILTLGIYLRLYNLSTSSFWYDEALGIVQARDPGSIISLKDTTPPLYIFFLHYLKKVSNNEFGLRLFSLIFGSASIVMVYILGKMLFTKREGVISAFLLAISPFHIYYSQEVRPYSLIALTTLIAVYFLIKSLNNRNIFFWAGYVFFNLLNIHFHYIGLFIWLAQNIFFFLIYRDSGKELKKSWLMSNSIIFLLFLPNIALFIEAVKESLNSFSNCSWIPFWHHRVSLKSLVMTFKNFSIGYNAVKIVYVPMTVIFFFLFIRGVKKTLNKKGAILSLLCVFVPVLGMFVVSIFKPVYADRYFIGSSLFYYFIVSAGMKDINKRWVTLILALVLILSLFSIKNYCNNFLPYEFDEHLGVQKKKDHRGVAEYIAGEFRKGDVVYHSCDNTIFPFIYYSDKLGNNAVDDDNGICLFKFSRADRPGLVEFNAFSGAVNIAQNNFFSNYERLWLIFSTWDFENIKPEAHEFATVKWLDDNYTKIGHRNFDGIIVYLYEK